MLGIKLQGFRNNYKSWSYKVVVMTIEEIRWALNSWLQRGKQWSRNMWLVGGDRNSSFFHAKASNRHQRNSIKGLCDADGNWQEDDSRLETFVVDYFANIFKSNGLT